MSGLSLGPLGRVPSSLCCGAEYVRCSMTNSGPGPLSVHRGAWTHARRWQATSTIHFSSNMFKILRAPMQENAAVNQARMQLMQAVATAHSDRETLRAIQMQAAAAAAAGTNTGNNAATNQNTANGIADITAPPAQATMIKPGGSSIPAPQLASSSAVKTAPSPDPRNLNSQVGGPAVAAAAVEADLAAPMDMDVIDAMADELYSEAFAMCGGDFDKLENSASNNCVMAEASPCCSGEYAAAYITPKHADSKAFTYVNAAEESWQPQAL